MLTTCVELKLNMTMPISRHKFEYIMKMVVAWANDVPFSNWLQLRKKIHNWDDLDTAPD